MLEKSITSIGSLQSSLLDKIVVVSTEEHFEGIDHQSILEKISTSTGIPCELAYVKGPTNSVIDTLTQYFESLAEDVEVIIKDADNLVKTDLQALFAASSAITFARLTKFPDVPAPNKSFVEIDSKGFVTNFVEKQVISELFSVGMIRLSRVSDFLAGAALLHGTNSELYMSDLVRALMAQGFEFRAIEADDYEDWGTLTQWLSMKSQYMTLFLDIDGVIARNASPISNSLDWDSFLPIPENLEYALELERSGRVQIIFTTSRGTQHEEGLRTHLENQGFRTPRILSNLLHSKRVLVNDFAPTNPFPSASAINLQRNSPHLREML